MKYKRIIGEIACNQWAMTHESFGAMMSIINGVNDDSWFKLFHSMDEGEKLAFIGDLGEREEGNDLVRIKGNVGILDIDGPIVHRASGVSKVSGLTSIEGLGREFQELEANPNIETILLLLDSPGGVVKGTSDFAEMVAGCNKKTVAYIYGAAASAAYWIASAADTIISGDTGVAGALGVIMTIDDSEDNGKIKIVSSQTPNKELSLSTKEGMANVQEVVDDIADVFLGAVARNRKTTIESVTKNYGKGKIFVAEEAKRRGMIDSIATLQSTIESLNRGDQMQGSLTVETYPQQRANMDQAQIQANIDDESSDVPDRNKKKEGRKMTLKEMLAQYPELKGEINAIVDTEIKAYKNVAAQASKFLGDEYKGPIANLAISVMAGNADLSSLIAAVAAVDQSREDAKSRVAQVETEETGEVNLTKPVGQASQDGIIRGDADIEAAQNLIKSGAMFA